MIRKEDVIEIGKFLKPHGLKGELNAVLDVDDTYAEDGNPLIVEMDGILVPFYVESFRPKGSEACLVKLAGIDSQQDSRQFVNKIVYGLRSDLENYFDSEDLDIESDLIGFKMFDKELGEIGNVIDIDDSTANVLFVVESPEQRMIYVPAAEEFITAIDDERKIIETSLPAGLIDLNI